MSSAPVLPSVDGGFVLPEDEYTGEQLEEIKLLARLVHAEARGEPYLGQVAVAAVALNRLKHPDFNTLWGVIYQPRQFEVVATAVSILPTT